MMEINTSINTENDFVAQENEIQFKDSSNRQKLIKNISEEDLISELPDSIILHILSLLRSTREAIRTGVLSKKWQYLWTLVPILIFGDFEFFPTEKYEIVKIKKYGIASIVDGILILRGHNKLKSLVITTSAYTGPYQPQLNVVIRYAVRCNVEELRIDAFNDEEDDFLLPEHLFRNSFFTELHFDYCIWDPIGEINWKNLTSLCIGHQCLNQKLINSVLSGSPSLEILQLLSCNDEELDVLNITSTSLRKLIVCGYMWTHRRVLKIQAPNILSLEITGDISVSSVVLLDVRSLVEAYLNYYNSEVWDHEIDTANEMEEDMLKKIIQGLQHVNYVESGSSCVEVLSRLEAKGFPICMKFTDRS